MSEVLDKVREKYPAYKDVDDASLARALAGKFPQYLEQEDFRREVTAAMPSGRATAPMPGQAELALPRPFLAGFQGTPSLLREEEATAIPAYTLAEALTPSIQVPREPIASVVDLGIGPLVRPDLSRKVAEGTAEVVAGGLESLSSPLGLLGLTPLGLTAVPDMAKEAYTRLKEGWQEGDAKKLTEGIELAGLTAAGTLGGYKMVRGLPRAIKATAAEQTRPVPPRLKAVLPATAAELGREAPTPSTPPAPENLIARSEGTVVAETIPIAGQPPVVETPIPVVEPSVRVEPSVTTPVEPAVERPAPPAGPPLSPTAAQFGLSDWFNFRGIGVPEEFIGKLLVSREPARDFLQLFREGRAKFEDRVTEPELQNYARELEGLVKRVQSRVERSPALTSDIVPRIEEPVVESVEPAATTPPTSLPPTSLGPGAASPEEFAQRLRQPPGPPPATIEGGKPGSIDTLQKPPDYNLFNMANRGQQAFTTGRLGEPAKAAFEKMALGEFEMREGIQRDTTQFIDNLKSTLPHPLRRQGGRAFFDVLDGRRMEEIEAQWANQPAVVEAARALKTRLEVIRTDIRDIKRQASQQSLESFSADSLTDLYRNTIGEPSTTLAKTDMAHALALAEIPDDWGIADGSYLPHMFFGQYKITTQQGGRLRFVTRARTVVEAKARIREFSRSNPDFANADFIIEPDITIPADMVRLFDKRFFSLVNRMKEQGTLSREEVRAALQGNIGRKAGKQKWFGSLQERQGAQNYERDFSRVLSAYFAGFHRWKVLSRLQREVTPLIEQTRQEGRFKAAARLESLMDNLWGKPAESTVLFDNLLQSLPRKLGGRWIAEHVEPLALDRWSRFARNVAAFAHLTTPRYFFVNRLQTLQGLYPIVGERIYAQARRMQFTPEGRKLLDTAGVTLDLGQYSETSRGKLGKLREKISGERSNQEIAFLATYLHGLDSGLTPAEAIPYGKLRGQLMTQFTPLTVDIPQLFEGPVGQTIFQYKRFEVGQLELIYNLLKEGKVGGVARMLGVLGLTGGLSYYLRQLHTDKDIRLKLRRTLEAELGPDGADAVFYGLPGLVGADISGSLILGEPPMGQTVFEQVGRGVLGPAPSTVIDLTRTLAKEPREPTTLGERAGIVARRLPAFKFLESLSALAQGDYDVLSPDGEVAYRRALRDVLLGMGSFRTANESNQRVSIDAIVELSKEEQSLKNAYYVARQSGEGLDTVRAKIDSFNERWPEARITSLQLAEYYQRRLRDKGKTDTEKLVPAKKYQQLMPAQP